MNEHPASSMTGLGGGRLTLLDGIDALVATVADLAYLIARAARDGVPFDDVSVFRHRSNVIKKYL